MAVLQKDICMRPEGEEGGSHDCMGSAKALGQEYAREV